MFQYPEYQLFEETVYKDIAFGPINQGKTGEELDRCVREAARLVGIRTISWTSPPLSSPAARSAGWPGGGHGYGPRCWCWTSPPPDWIRRAGRT